MSSNIIDTDLAAAAERGFMGCAITASSPGQLLALVPRDALLDGSLRWAHDAATAAISDGATQLDPLVIADAARRHHLEPPAAIGSQVLSYLHEIVRDAPPSVMGAHYAGVVLADATRRTLKEACERILSIVDQGEVSEVAQFAQREFGAALATVAGVTS